MIDISSFCLESPQTTMQAKKYDAESFMGI